MGRGLWRFTFSPLMTARHSRPVTKRAPDDGQPCAQNVDACVEQRGFVADAGMPAATMLVLMVAAE